MNPSQTTSVPLIVKIQVALAVLATVVTIALALYIPRLIQKKVQLESDISKLNEQKADLEKRTEAAKSAYRSLANNLDPEQAQKAIEQSLKSNPQAAAILPRVFIHIRAASQGSGAKQVAGTLRQQGYIVPGIQMVNKGPDETQVRYFHGTDQKEAKNIADLLVGSGVKDVKPELIGGHEDIRPRQYEIWFAPNSL